MARQISPELLRCLQTAVQWHQDGRLEDALGLYQRVLAQEPGANQALYLGGLASASCRRLDLAGTLLRAATRLEPGSSDAHGQLAMLLLAAGRRAEALERLEHCLVLDPSSADMFANQGIVLAEMSGAQESLYCFDRSLRLRADHVEVHFNRGNSLARLQRDAEALAAFDAVLCLQPCHLSAMQAKATILQLRSRYELALTTLSQALIVNPQDASVLNDRGLVLRALQQPGAAISSYLAAVDVRPDFPQIWSSLGLVYLETMHTTAAVTAYDKALVLQPHHAESRVGRAIGSLRLGDYAAAWPDYEYRLQLRTPKPIVPDVTVARRWTGREPVAHKRLLLRAEQGLGDSLQMSRYVVQLAALGAQVILEVPIPLHRLLGCLPGVRQLVAPGATLPPHDYVCPLMSLPFAFGTTLQTIPFGQEPYLCAPSEDVERWSLRLVAAARGERRLRVGLVWNGGFRIDQPELWEENSRRNISLDIFARYLDVDGVDFFSLQKGDPVESELRIRGGALWRHGRLYNHSDDLHDFADTAGLIANLDLVVSVDTSTAHLAAAMGKPTWILNRYDTCWRWLLDRDDSPWYGSVRLYRQAADREWGPVLERVASDLVDLNKRHFSG